jgi:hypothetical protein
MQAESLVKAYILTHGVRFTSDALRHAKAIGAKRQNVVYNLPATAGVSVESKKNQRLSSAADSDELARPQELFLVGDDGYKVCVSAVAPVLNRECAVVSFRDGLITIETPSHRELGNSVASVEFVPQPAYYDSKTSSGRAVTRWVSACGYDEMNIWPWHDCAIKKACTFCGINSVQKRVGRNIDTIHALELRRSGDAISEWSQVRDGVVSEVMEAVELSIDDTCYRDECHLILISGNLADHQLDLQTLIYSELANAITSQYPNRFAEGAVAVTAPPRDLRFLTHMRDNGIEVGVFNLEAYSLDAFAEHCPGKASIGRDHYLDTLSAGVDVFGWGRSWSNFVLGLEPIEALLEGCEQLAATGITPGANVLHLDHGATLRCDPPTLSDVLFFYNRLAEIYRRNGHRPYYCERALRTSLANEAFAGRLDGTNSEIRSFQL